MCVRVRFVVLYFLLLFGFYILTNIFVCTEQNITLHLAKTNATTGQTHKKLHRVICCRKHSEYILLFSGGAVG
jgi:hypothetical protein